MPILSNKVNGILVASVGVVHISPYRMSFVFAREKAGCVCHAKRLRRSRDFISLMTLDQTSPALRRRYLRLLLVACSLANYLCPTAEWQSHPILGEEHCFEGGKAWQDDRCRAAML